MRHPKEQRLREILQWVESDDRELPPELTAQEMADFVDRALLALRRSVCGLVQSFSAEQAAVLSQDFRLVQRAFNVWSKLASQSELATV